VKLPSALGQASKVSPIQLPKVTPSSKMEYSKELGSGAFGTVYMVSDIQQPRAYYALKAVVCKDSSSVSTVIREVNTLAKARHERIVQILAADSRTLSNSDSLFLILTEFCSGGDLNSQLNNTSTPETNLKWISQISEALSYLHSLNPPIVHRDLKADNVLLTDQWSQDLKLGDFGLAREYLAMNNNDGSPQSAQTYYMTSGCGPMHWMAPEFFLNHYTEKADVFSLGGIFYAILIRDSIQVGWKNMYGVFLTYPYPNGKVGLGYAMAAINPNAKPEMLREKLEDENLQARVRASFKPQKQFPESSQRISFMTQQFDKFLHHVLNKKIFQQK
ncbi:serine threonine- kinase PDIK1L-like, partial [Paramuricea clavata]